LPVDPEALHFLCERAAINSSGCLRCVMLGVGLGRFPRVMFGMQRMAVCSMGMLCGVIVCTFAVVFRREPMMCGGVLGSW
jgi:hypothetical protein